LGIFQNAQAARLWRATELDARGRRSKCCRSVSREQISKLHPFSSYFDSPAQVHRRKACVPGHSHGNAEQQSEQESQA
jgi:hypothetical protein